MNNNILLAPIRSQRRDPYAKTLEWFKSLAFIDDKNERMPADHDYTYNDSPYADDPHAYSPSHSYTSN